VPTKITDRQGNRKQWQHSPFTGNLETSLCEPQRPFPPWVAQRTMGSSAWRRSICTLVHIHSLSTCHVLVWSRATFI